MSMVESRDRELEFVRNLRMLNFHSNEIEGVVITLERPSKSVVS